MTPIRIQRKRTKGWRMPPNTVYVGRPTIWGNPFPVGHSKYPTRKYAVARFRMALTLDRGYWTGKYSDQWMSVRRVNELRGKNLACWCPLDAPCHADVLLKIANSPG